MSSCQWSINLPTVPPFLSLTLYSCNGGKAEIILPYGTQVGNVARVMPSPPFNFANN